jgi:4-hydroxybenzoate polyprenyltransferase
MRQYLILFRPYGILFLGLIPVFSAIANGEFSLFNLTLLCILGFLVHIFTFVQNDYYDREIDSRSSYVSNRPLSSGIISQKTVLVIFVSCFILSLIITILTFFSIFSLLALLLSFLLITAYNKYSKRHFGMEYVLSFGVLSFGIFGALTVSNNITFFVILISTYGFMQWLFSVGISANLKDVEFDSKQGIRTTPIVLGVKAVDSNLIIPSTFKIYSFLIKIIHISIAFPMFLFGYTSIFVYNFPIPGICFLLISVILIYLTWKILSTPMTQRDKMLIYIGLQEGLALLLLPITLMSYLIENISIIPTISLVFIIILWPILTFRILFGKRMIPLE